MLLTSEGSSGSSIQGMSVDSLGCGLLRVLGHVLCSRKFLALTMESAHLFIVYAIGWKFNS